MRPADKKRWVRSLMAAEKRDIERLNCAIWKLAELPLQETQSAKLLADYLASRGFTVTWPIRVLPTAFKAVWGKGRPAIGFLGEYDALPNVGLEPGTNGHGCGHNALGTAAAAGAVATAKMLAGKKKPGRVIYWGCPAEEALGGKIYMARDGAFRKLDAALCWHPGGRTCVRSAGGAALDSIVFDFRGRTAHAGGNPEGGRSALDAALLMDVAVNYLREHTPENVRIHSIIPEGGTAPNVVPGHARIWYYVRGTDREQVDDLTRRVKLCAKGAAMASGTRVRSKMLSCFYSRLENDPMAETVRRNLLLMGAPKPTASDRKHLDTIRPDLDLAKGVDLEAGTTQARASSDEDAVSWVTPLGSFAVACVAPGTSGHHRDWTAQMAMPLADRATVRAAEIFAGVGWDLFTDAALRRSIRAEFTRGTRGFTFDPLLGNMVYPPKRDIFR
jgi:aminobenzoyl-glutamate utilization protein B